MRIWDIDHHVPQRHGGSFVPNFPTIVWIYVFLHMFNSLAPNITWGVTGRSSHFATSGGQRSAQSCARYFATSSVRPVERIGIPTGIAKATVLYTRALVLGKVVPQGGSYAGRPKSEKLDALAMTASNRTAFRMAMTVPYGRKYRLSHMVDGRFWSDSTRADFRRICIVGRIAPSLARPF